MPELSSPEVFLNLRPFHCLWRRASTPTGYTDAAVNAVWVGVGALVLAAIAALFLPPGKGPAVPDAEAAAAEAELEWVPASVTA